MQKINNKIYFIKNGKPIKNVTLQNNKEKEINEIAKLKLPIFPYIIIRSNILNITKSLHTYLELLKKEMNNIYDNNTLPFLFKIEMYSILFPLNSFTVKNIGFTKNNINIFESKIGKQSTNQYLLDFLNSICNIYEMNKNILDDNKKQNKIITELYKIREKIKYSYIINEYNGTLSKSFFEDEKLQLENIIKLMVSILKLEKEDKVILISPIIYEDFKKGYCFSRNIITGEKTIEGKYLDKDIVLIEEQYLEQVREIARVLEETTKEIIKFNFVIINQKLYLAEWNTVENQAMEARLKLLLDLYHKNIIKAEHIINRITLEELNEILHPILDVNSIKNLKKSNNCIAGAIGLVHGKVYFSSHSLIEAKKQSTLKGKHENFILCITASYANDVQGIEESVGVLSKEGGYASHAAVVARQYGKASLIHPNMQILENKAIIENNIINEGDEITLHIPNYKEAKIYFGKGRFIIPDYEKNGILELINIAKLFIKKFVARANIDSPKEATLALKLGAYGIGLCRTEHMFFDKERINIFREMIVSRTSEKRQQIISLLKTMQVEDFYQILKIMKSKPVTIRLLDAPLHEFLPNTEIELKKFEDYLKTRGVIYKKDELFNLIKMFSEKNPMLGNRGCRIAIKYPEIYIMQIEAIFEAIYKLKEENIDSNIEIMVPFVMNMRELKQIIFGKKIEGKQYLGIDSIEKTICEKFNAKHTNYKTGIMLELPCSALNADELARYANFFSFGTNDLTQTTLGLSRDDINAFAQEYNMYDIFREDPFVILEKSVKELIEIAITRGRLTRPDITFGLCGEQGAIPINIKYFWEKGGDYVSCSPYSLPTALLTIAQLEIKKSSL